MHVREHSRRPAVIYTVIMEGSPQGWWLIFILTNESVSQLVELVLVFQLAVD